MTPRGMFNQGLKEIRRDQRRMEKQREREELRKQREEATISKMSREMEKLGYGGFKPK